jgi:predicted Fe-Mo cluster-binding NifX family protein
MKIAVASSDGKQISPHFGRSSHFLIFDVEAGKIVGRELRENIFTAHARGECGGQGAGEHHGMNSHASIVQALSDCSAVLCYGMGWRASEALSQGGVQPFVLGKRCSPEDAVALYLEGALSPAGGDSCPGHG